MRLLLIGSPFAIAGILLSFCLLATAPGKTSRTNRLIGSADDGSSYLPPKGYVCYRASSPVKIDDRLDNVAWPN